MIEQPPSWVPACVRLFGQRVDDTIVVPGLYLRADSAHGREVRHRADVRVAREQRGDVVTGETVVVDGGAWLFIQAADRAARGREMIVQMSRGEKQSRKVGTAVSKL